VEVGWDVLTSVVRTTTGDEVGGAELYALEEDWGGKTENNTGPARSMGGDDIVKLLFTVTLPPNMPRKAIVEFIA
jgi:hypothetical protein